MDVAFNPSVASPRGGIRAVRDCDLPNVEDGHALTYIAMVERMLDIGVLPEALRK